MDPISIIVGALVAGAAAGLQPTAEQAVKDAYAAMKGFISRRFSRVSVDALEVSPGSKPRQEVLREDLTAANAGQDNELLRLAEQLIDAVRNHAPEQAAVVGVDIDGLHAAALRIADVESSGTGVRIQNTEAAGDVEIKGVRAGTDGSARPKDKT